MTNALFETIDKFNPLAYPSKEKFINGPEQLDILLKHKENMLAIGRNTSNKFGRNKWNDEAMKVQSKIDEMVAEHLNG